MACLLVASPVFGQPTDKQKAQAADLVKKAIAKSQGNDHQAAIDLYKQAYDLNPAPPYGPPLLANEGNEYLALDKPVEALKAFCAYLDADPNGPMADFARAQAKVTRDKLGDHDVALADVCKPKVEAPPPPPVQQPLPPAPPPASHGMSGLQMSGIAVGAAGVVMFAIGGYFGKLARDDSNKLTNHDKTMPWPDDILAIESEGQGYENKQIALMVIGGAAIVGGVAMYVLGRHSERSSTEVSIVPTKGGGAFSFSRRF